MSDTKLAYFNAPPEQWTILGYYQFRKQQSDFSGIFRWENGLLKKALGAIIQNSENDFKIERAHGMLNNLKTQLFDPGVVAFWKEIDLQRELELKKKHIELTRADGVLHVITATNQSQKYVMEIQHQDLLALQNQGKGIGQGKAWRRRSDRIKGVALGKRKLEDEGDDDTDNEDHNIASRVKKAAENSSLTKPYLLKKEYSSKHREITADDVDNPFLVSKAVDQYEDFLFEDLESDDGSEYTPSNTDEVLAPPPLPMLPSQLKCFAESHARMSQSRKWILSSGTYVEDVLFREGNRLSVESMLHSWIIDLGDGETEKLFTTEDWREINRAVCIQPKVDEYVARSLARFNVRSVADLRKVLETTSYRNEDESYNRSRHFDAEWIENVMRHFLTEYEDPDEALKKEHLEGWFDVNVWAVIIDRAFRNISGLEVVRKESASKAVTARKNRARTLKDRSKIGRRIDGIFRTYDNVEYGSIEVAKTFVHVSSTKRLMDQLKLVKSMHDMLVCLGQLVRFDERKVGRLQIVGFLHSGLKLQVYRMTNPKGYVSLLVKEQLHEVPAEVDKLKKLIMLLASIWRAKKMVTDCMEVMNEELPDLTEEEFIQEIVESSTMSPPRSIYRPWSFDTPKSKRR